MNHIFIIVGTVAVGLFAAGLALFSLFEEEKRREKPHSRGRSPPSKPPSPPPKPRSPPPRRQNPPPTPRNPPPTPRNPPPTRSLSPNLRHRQTSNENHSSNSRLDAALNYPNSLPGAASNSAVSQETSSRHEDAPVVSGSQVIGASINENNSSLCFQATECTNCEDEEADLVTYSPCGGSYFCNGCAMQYLERNEHCSLCRRRITSIK